jgi:hypothetical protein
MAEKPASAPATAKIRIAGIFIQKFSVWRTELPDCAKPASKPWLYLECGFAKCPKPAFLDIPLELDYSNWRQSPRMTEVEIEADKPFTMHLGGKYVHGSLGQGIAAAAGIPFTLNRDSCIFDASFTPRGGAMYEATIDPSGNGCALRLTEIRYSDTSKEYERIAVEGAETRACGQNKR